jgi:chromosome segregation ATPase
VAAQTPPQGEVLATEYVHNLQQQLYFLNAELRFLHDRSGVDSGPDGLSVDASIRRLRRACAMHEEETNKRIQELERQIGELTQATQAVDESRALEVLALADGREREGLSNLENAFVEMAGEVLVRQIEQDKFAIGESFRASHKAAMLDSLDERSKHIADEQQEVRGIEGQLEELRKVRKRLLGQCKESIKNRRYCEEEADVLTIVANEPERALDNPAKATLLAKNAKIEMDLKAALAARNEVEHHVDLLLEKNVRLKAQLNIANRELERARYLEENMNRTLAAKYAAMRKAADDQTAELTALKRHRKETKQEIAGAAIRLNELAAKVTQFQVEQEFHQTVTGFREKQKANIDEENEQTKRAIHGLADRICELREKLDRLAHEVADAAEAQRSVTVLVEINNRDPRCALNDPPPELEKLLESLTAVKQSMRQSEQSIPG